MSILGLALLPVASILNLFCILQHAVMLSHKHTYKGHKHQCSPWRNKQWQYTLPCSTQKSHTDHTQDDREHLHVSVHLTKMNQDQDCLKCVIFLKDQNIYEDVSHSRYSDVYGFLLGTFYL